MSVCIDNFSLQINVRVACAIGKRGEGDILSILAHSISCSYDLIYCLMVNYLPTPSPLDDEDRRG